MPEHADFVFLDIHDSAESVLRCVASISGRFSWVVWPGWRHGHDYCAAHLMTVHLKVVSEDEISVIIIAQSWSNTIETLVVLFISFSFLLLMSVSSKLYNSQAEG